MWSWIEAYEDKIQKDWEKVEKKIAKMVDKKSVEEIARYVAKNLSFLDKKTLKIEVAGNKVIIKDRFTEIEIEKKPLKGRRRKEK
uniref:Uncharacterized protein n=1 Tax=Caldicellulosiruptor owensensis TaxID=55205 RepID=A0A7C5Z8S1_9FIRM